MEINQKFLTPVKKIFLGVLIYVIAGLIYSVVNPLMLFGGGAVVKSFYYTATAAIVVGYVFAFIGLNDFKNVTEDADRKAVELIRTGYIFLAASVLLKSVLFNCTLTSEWIVDPFVLVSAIMLVIGYSKLSKSGVFNKAMKDGFSILFLATVFILVSACFDFIPFTGKILRATFNFSGCPSSECDIVSEVLWAIFNFSGLIITLIGWNKVKRGAVKAK